jgi:putative endonuclease
MDSNHEPRKKLRLTAVQTLTKDMFYEYVLHSVADHGLYIGYSTDLKKRLSEHKQRRVCRNEIPRPWKLIYYEAYLNRADALGREKYLKSGSGRRFLKTQLRNYLAQTPIKEPRDAGFTRYTHVLNKPGLGVRSPLDHVHAVA